MSLARFKITSTEMRIILSFTLVLNLVSVFMPRQLCQAQSEAPFLLPNAKELARLRTAVIYTDEGELTFRLFPGEAPWHVANFKYRADKGLYRNTQFHIYHPGYIIQAGGPRSNPAAPAGYTIPAEFNSHKHVFGALGMARKADFANPERSSSGNQFHIILGDAPHMNGAFTVFGELASSDEILERLGQGTKIKDIKVFVEPSYK